MISAPSLLLLSSGNKWTSVLILFAVLCLVSCDATQRTTKTRTTPTVSKDTPDREEDKSSTIMDTVSVIKKTDDIKIIDENSEDRSDKSFGSMHKIALLLPLNSSVVDSSDFENEEAMESYHYYLGFNLAAAQWEKRALDFRIELFDTKSTSLSKLKERLQRDFSVWIGGKDKTDEQLLSSISRSENQMYINPFRRISDVTTGINIELEPRILSQLNFISEFVLEQHEDKMVTLAVEKGDENRLKVFQQYIETAKGKEAWDNFRTLVVSDDSRHLEETDLTDYIDPSGESVFILPYTSGVFMRTFLRKLKADKETSDMIVYGLHHWIENDDIDLDAHENMELRMASWHYPQYETAGYDLFERKFYEKYGFLPAGSASVKGYDHGKFILESLYTSNFNISRYNENGSYYGVFTELNIGQNIPHDEAAQKLTSYENNALRMIRYQKGKFVPIR